MVPPGRPADKNGLNYVSSGGVIRRTVGNGRQKGETKEANIRQKQPLLSTAHQRSRNGRNLCEMLGRSINKISALAGREGGNSGLQSILSLKNLRPHSRQKMGGRMEIATGGAEAGSVVSAGADEIHTDRHGSVRSSVHVRLWMGIPAFRLWTLAGSPKEFSAHLLRKEKRQWGGREDCATQTGKHPKVQER